MKILSVFVFLFLFLTAFNVRAETDSQVSENDTEEVVEIETNTDSLAFDENAKSAEDAKNASPDNEKISYVIEGGENVSISGYRPLPDCSDERLLELVRGDIIGYQNRNPASSIIEKRQQMLMLKRISSLSDISSENVTSKENFKLANELIILKINQAIPSTNIKVCKGPKGINNVYLYVIVYDDGNFIKGKILNFAKEGPKEQELEILY